MWCCLNEFGPLTLHGFLTDMKGMIIKVTEGAGMQACTISERAKRSGGVDRPIKTVWRFFF